MKTTKESVFECIQKMIYIEKENVCGVETKVIAEKLNMQRSNVSKLLNELVKEKKLEKTNTRPVLYKMPQQKIQFVENSCFTNLIGHNGSLRNAIQLAKAAILYPSSSLNVLLSSSQGSGTTYFATLMFDFAKEKGVLLENAPFVKLNCRHYSKSVSVLDDELFGKGNDLLDSCFIRARGGMLFIENFDLLEARQQSFVYDFIETGKLYSKDRNRYLECENVFLVISCTQQNITHINEKIPVTIKLPELKDRDMKERFELINNFFSIEALNSNRSIEVTSEAMKALLLTDFNYGIKELEFEIKTACANAYVRVVNEVNQKMCVCKNDLQKQIKNSLLKLREKSSEIDILLGYSEIIYYDKNKGFQDQYLDKDSNDLYIEIKKQYDELANRGINDSSIENVINTHIQSLFKEYSYNKMHDTTNNLEQLSKIVDNNVITVVENWLNTCQQKLNKTFKSNVFYGLCLHINSLLNKSRVSKKVDNNQIVEIIQNYPKEYAASSQFVNLLQDEFDLELGLDEIVLITMFILEYDEEEIQRHPVLLYILHGNTAASSLKDVTNSLTQCYNAYSYDLSLDIDTKQAKEEIKSLIISIDQGAGVIVIYDMGSIKTMIEAISDEIDIKIRVLNIPITLLGIDLARKCSMESDIDYVYHIANLNLKSLNNSKVEQSEAIITLCNTGEGGAVQLKNYIDRYSKLGMKTIPLCISDRNELLKEIQVVQMSYKIHAFVGTYDPKLLGIPFISITKIFENSKKDIDKVLQFEPIHNNSFSYSAVYSYLEEEFKYTSIPKLKIILPDVVDEISIIYSLDEDLRVGLFMHLACLIERLIQGEVVSENKQKEKILKVFEEDCKVISKIIKRIEKNFKVIIDDNELATIIMMIKKI